jgi:hypothetical protein
VAKQAYVEDCEVCCNPIEFDVACGGGEIHRFEVRELGQ